MAKSIGYIEQQEGYPFLYIYTWYRGKKEKEILLIRQPQKRRAFANRVDIDRYH